MSLLESPLRYATENDAFALAELVNYAGDGLPLELWRSIAGPEEDPWEIGRARQAARVREGHWVVVDEGTVVAALHGYPTPQDGSRILTSQTPPIMVPMLAMEARVPGVFFINVLAAYPRARGRGLGARLVRYAEASAQEQGLSGVAILLGDQNQGALRLYQRLGYREHARSAMEKGGWDNPSTQWVLLTKRFAK